MGIIPRTFSEISGEVIGINAKMFTEKFGVSAFGKTKIYEKIFDRQNALVNLSDIYLCLPGGVGTISELFNTLVLNDLHYKIKKYIF